MTELKIEQVTEDDRQAAVRALVAHVAGRDREVAEIFATHRQSAERRALERAAEVAESEAGAFTEDGEGDYWIALRISRAIRALGDE